MEREWKGKEREGRKERRGNGVECGGDFVGKCGGLMNRKG